MPKKHKILIVDDSEINRSLLSDMLTEEFELLEAANGLEAIAQLNQNYADISLVLLDVVMPEMDGFEVLSTMNKSGWMERIPVIMISAETSSSYMDHAYDLGAAEYISRPFDEKTVKRRVKNTIMLYSKQKALENLVTEQMLEKEKTNMVMVEILSHIVEFRNGESGMHVLHIRIITESLLKHLAKISDQYNLTPNQIALITNASALHDIGKISIPEQILNKPGKLTAEEFEIVKTHSAIGAEMLENIQYFQSEKLVQIARDICRWHHERYDGGGYPDGLKGEEIPISAQVVALADVYDALTSARVYKPAYDHEKAMAMILDGQCGAFNPLLLQCLEEIGPYLKDELRIRSAEGVSREELQKITKNLLRGGNASNRTLALLEQERTKYQFFASMSKEIQFEYVYHSDILTMSEWGAALLGINAIIPHPQANEELSQVFSPQDFYDLHKRLRAATTDDPIVSRTYRLNVNGEERWYKAIARPLWVEESSDELTGVIGKFVDVHEEQIELAQLKQMARYDSLTGLYNRSYARKSIIKALAARENDDQKFALIIFDLDFFKNANDNYGHLFGDRVLEDVAQKVAKSIRSSDIAARIGGDEFLIFIEYENDIEPIIQRIFQAINGKYRDFSIAISMGVALAPQNSERFEELFHQADQALYAAKQNGRKHYCFYDDSMENLLSVLSPMDK